MRSLIPISILLIVSIANAGQVEKEFCAAKWPADYEMQEYCHNNQLAAKDLYFKIFVHYLPKDRNGSSIDLNKLKREEVPEEINICFRCNRKWRKSSGHVDWEMATYCTKNQLASYNKLNNKPNAQFEIIKKDDVKPLPSRRYIPE